MNNPEFDSIKNYEEFTGYKWDRAELKNICRAHGLLFVGTEKKLNKVIEAYFNGEVIPPRRNWYTNSVLLRTVNISISDIYYIENVERKPEENLCKR